MRPLLFICLAASLLLTACASPGKNQFVLVPGSDGKTGKIEVTNRGGSRTLDTANQTAEVTDSVTAPGSARTMEPAEIARIFGSVLAAEPLPPARFILYFETNSSRLTADSGKLLPEVVAAIAARNSADVSIVGHSDRTGTRAKNYDLSRERAQRVRELLTSRGASAAILEVDSHGQDNPLVPTADGVAEPRNRRVEVTVR
ncbi:MAG TPA: OmpA family protein [Syntrophorhabdaceae bacterium]|jgi:outer membrane protein OmpA-like peptidoglycan-associated protein